MTPLKGAALFLCCCAEKENTISGVKAALKLRSSSRSVSQFLFVTACFHCSVFLFLESACIHLNMPIFCFDMLWFVGLLFRSWEEKASTFNILVQLRPRTNLRMFITTTVHTLVPMVALMLFRRCLPVYTGTKCVLGVRHKLFTSLSFCFCTGIRDGKSMH